ncbi:MAG: virulence protein SciE type [Acidobacteria bacterium]|nr:virulence protein SciE type [Acidobacteriota bacterium]
MNANELFRAGKLQESIQALSAELRDNPGDARRRTFLFELLCFAGDYSRAEKHLNLLADASPDAGIGALVLRSAVSAERKRQAFFEAKQYKEADPVSRVRPGKLNGEPFRTIEDIDPRIGPRLEVFVAGEYVWLPFAHLGTFKMEPPRLLRDLIWCSAFATAGPELRGQDFGEVLLPILYPFSSRHASDDVKLGRQTDWVLDEVEPLEIPYGQKMLVLDGDRAVPFLEIRSIEFDDTATADAQPE